MGNKNNLDVKVLENQAANLKVKANLLAASSTEPGYSNAPTYSALGYEVDPRTGTLQVTLSPPTFFGALGSDITPSIVYSPQSVASGITLLGLPLGWSYSFSYIAASQVFINGSSAYYIDDMYDSGLRYYNLKDLVFTNDSGMFPYDNQLTYSNTLQFIGGETQYFDAHGRLIGMVDRWGNPAIFYYTKEGDVYSSKLSRIVGFAGQAITFAYSGEGIEIAYPQGGKNDISFAYLVDSQSYLVGYVNPLGQKFTIANRGGLVRNDLISQITYPNNVSVVYEYSTLRYYVDANRSQFYRIDCIATTRQSYVDTAGQIQTRSVSYSYDPNGDAHDYTGYPTYIMGKYQDTLLQSNDDDYRYVSQVDDGVLVVEHQYNRLHLELVTKTFTKDVPRRLIRQVTNTFISETDGKYFPPYYELKLIPNYQTPIKVVTEIYNDAGETLISEIESDFDDYGAPTEVRSYSSRVAGEAPKLLNKVQTLYDYAGYGQLVRQDTYDCTDGTILRRIANDLTDDKKNIATSTDGFVVSTDGKDIFSPNKKITYRYNASGKVVYEKLEWADGESHALESTETSTRYALAVPVLTVTTTNAQGIPNTTEIDTVTGWMISQANALNYGSSYTYDNIGRQLTSTDPMGVVTECIFNDPVNKATTRYANGYETYAYNNGFTDLVKTADNGGNDKAERTLTANGYNDKGQLIWTEGILGADSRILYSYDSRNQLATATDALGNVNRYEYDTVAQTKTEFFNGVKVSTLSKHDNALNQVTYSSQLSSESLSASSLSNSYSNIIKSLTGDPSAGKEWLAASFQYDVNNLVSSYSTTGSDNIVQRQDISRDLFTNAVFTGVDVSAPGTKASTAGGDTYFYDNLNQLLTDTNALGQQYRYVYNEIGLVSSYTDYAGTVFACGYNANNQLVSVAWTDQGVQCKKQYTYDPLTYKVLSIEEFRQGVSNGSIAYGYSLGGAIESVTYPDGKKILYEYDLGTGLLSTFTDAIGKVTQYTYDNYGRVTRQQIVGEEYSVQTDYYSKEESAANSGKLKSIQVSNGISSSFSYDGFGSLAQAVITDTSEGATHPVLLVTQYTYDPITRNLVTLQSSSGAFAQDANLNYLANYSFNSLNQLTEERKQILGGEVAVTAYRYDAACNVIGEERRVGATSQSTTYTYDQDNKLLRIDASSGARNFAYDANGNLTDDGTGGTYRYNAQNRLIGYSDVGGNLVAEYDYYPDGLRASKKVNDGAAIRFYYDYSSSPNIVNEIQGDKTSHYLAHGSKRYVRLVDSAGITVPEYFIASFRDIVGVLDASCEREASYAYEPYGQEEGASQRLADISVNPFRYTAEYTDLESSLIYLRARYYHPGIKRFMSRDTTDLINRYNYANGNPIMGSDPSGDLSIGWMIGAAIAGIAVGLITGGAGALVLGTGMGASIAVGAVAGVAGTAASNGITEWGLHASGEPGLSAKDWGVSLLAGAVSGAVGAGVGGAVGRGAMSTAMNAGWSAGRVTAVGVLSASVSGGFSGSVASAGVTAGFEHQAFFSADVWENIGISAAVGMGAGVMASGAHFGFGKVGGIRTTPVEMSATEFNVVTDTTTPNTILEFNPREANQWQGGNLGAMTAGQDTVIVHGHPRFSFPEDVHGRYRYASAKTTAQAIQNNIGGGGGTIRLISCSAGKWIGVENMAQTIANTLNRPVEAYTVAISIAEVVNGTVTPVTYQPV
ncbi:tRNA(Glu)-specific nuclease WapA [Serratia plymuthica]|uniref:RHS repeat domain-containing protein n=1 Tax=Serratia plymuthica TaxID=82996 RepID=UPI00034C07B9|nr:RHS repeat-associated core domain-containing protein [Serratia plymuthica]QJW55715.1 tRNA(Glu)-specific nuclease WapA [Serratia plymuthica]